MGNPLDLHALVIGNSPLTNAIYLYRTGKRPGPALDKREITGEAVAAVIAYVMHGFPKGAVLNVSLGDKTFDITVKPVEVPRG